MKKTIVYTLLIALLLTGCGQKNASSSTLPQSSNEATQAVTIDPTLDRYTLKSTLTDWETEYTVKTEVKHIVDYRGHYAYVIAEVQNTGKNPIHMYDLALEGYALKDTVGTSSDVYLFDLCYPIVLFPGETGYLYGDSITRDLWPEEQELTAVWQEDGITHTCLTTADVNEFFSILDTSNEEIVVNENGDLVLKGNVTNSLSSEQSSIIINAVLFDALGQPLGLLGGIVDSLSPNETAEFVLMGYLAEALAPSDVASWKIEAYVTN